MSSPPKSDVTTHGIRVEAGAFYLPEHSEPDNDHYVYGYQIVVTNNTDATVRLVRRHWNIIDANGTLDEIDGEGVVGQTPTLKPGESFKYHSFAPLPTTWGTMDGFYTLQREGGESFDVRIGRFLLTQEHVAPAPVTR